MPSRIQEILQSFKKNKILVIGDLILDHYAFGSVNRISPEAPIQVFDVKREEYRLGGAANVAKNMVTLGAEVTITGVVGKDESGALMHKKIKNQKIFSSIFQDQERPTTLKTRLISQGHHLLRTDREDRRPISSDLSRRFLQFCDENLASFDAIVISDYAKGLLTDAVCQAIIKLAAQKRKKVFVGPKGREWDRYSGAFLLSANRSEVEAVTGMEIKKKSDVSRVGQGLRQKLQLDAILITLGAEGIYLATDDEDHYFKAQAKEVFDVVGAGDTVLAVTSLASAAGYSWKTSIRLANASAGIVVAKVGTSTVYPEELVKLFSSADDAEKLWDLRHLEAKLALHKSQGQMIVLCHGAFELLHPDHIRYLEYSKNRGDILVVGVYGDSLFKKTFQNGAPALSDAARCEILSALSAVDYVFVLEERDFEIIIEKITPDILIESEDNDAPNLSGYYQGDLESYNLNDRQITMNMTDTLLKRKAIYDEN